MLPRLMFFSLFLLFPLAANAQSSGWGSRPLDSAAQADIQMQTQDHRSYAWDKPYCLRYFSSHPDLLILGDSIFDGWSGYLLHVFPDALIDARVGRQFSAGVRDYANLLRYPGVQETRTIVVELGTNGSVTPAQVEQFMQLAGSRQVFWITPSVPRPWQGEVLQVAHWASREYPNITLVHWHRDAEGKQSWFWGDGVHPNWTGIRHLVSLLQTTIGKRFASN